MQPRHVSHVTNDYSNALGRTDRTILTLSHPDHSGLTSHGQPITQRVDTTCGHRVHQLQQLRHTDGLAIEPLPANKAAKSSRSACVCDGGCTSSV